MIEEGDIQALVLNSYADLPHAALLPLSAANGADVRGALTDLSSTLRFWRKNQAAPTRVAHVALSASGLRKLDLEEEALRGFSVPFLEGMAGSENRSRDLGDLETSHPSTWDWGAADKSVDALLLLYARTSGDLQASVATSKAAAAARGLSLVTADPLEAAWLNAPGVEGFREHFGFVDGISQPALDLDGKGEPDDFRREFVAPGELLLGYVNEKRAIAPGATVSPTAAARRVGLAPLPNTPRLDLGRNGTYLVVRQLEQKVLGFWGFAKAHADVIGSTELCGAKLMGRWRNGAPLSRFPVAPGSLSGKVDENEFEFRTNKDETGMRCPIGAHTRRANPRDALLGSSPRSSWAEVQRHRILRRGRPYGPQLPGWPDPEKMLKQAAGAPDTGSRGMYFICINADIAEQFEHVQQRWLNDPTFVNPANLEVDPIVGRTRARSRFTVPRDPTPVLLGEHGVSCERFVRMRGGGYFFLPSRRALSYLAATDR